jgi:putative membrane protein
MSQILVAVPAALAALVHVYIFVLESLRITDPATMKVFGIASREEAEIMRPWAYNQGWYNLLLALQVAVGVVCLWAAPTVGSTLVVAGCAFMVAAALVLVTSDCAKLRAATVQGALPLLALLAWALTR